MSKIRTITYYEGKRQTGVTTRLLRESMNYSEKGQKVLFVACNQATATHLIQRLEGFLGLLPRTHRAVVDTELTKKDMENVKAVFINDYDAAQFDLESLIAEYPDVDFYMGTTSL